MTETAVIKICTFHTHFDQEKVGVLCFDMPIYNMFFFFFFFQTIGEMQTTSYTELEFFCILSHKSSSVGMSTMFIYLCVYTLLENYHVIQVQITCSLTITLPMQYSLFFLRSHHISRFFQKS